VLTLAGCEENYIPRPIGYLRFSLPEEQFQKIDLPFGSFEKPIYMPIVQKESPKGEYWFDLSYPTYKLTLHCSYKPINSNLFQLSEDAHYMAFKHTVKATAIDEIPINDSKRKVFGILYRLRGNVATNLQFYVTDSTRHFFRGTFYIHGRPNEDSLMPLIDFAQRNITHIINTLEWK